jgi:hypothetical protein
MNKTDENNHALRNAQAHIAMYVDACAKYQTLIDGRVDEEVEIDGDTFKDATELTDWLQEGALSVEIRDGWYTSGDKSGGPEEFKILVSTGGPAFRIIGELDQYNQPSNVRAEHQDWGTPWIEVELSNEEQEAVDWFAGLFYYGE